MSKSLSPIILSLLVLLSACGGESDYTPKPRGFFRIELPEKKYKTYTAACPFSFEYPDYARVIPDSSKDAEPCWLNVDLPQFKGRIHLSYKEFKTEDIYARLIEDTRKLAFKHTIKAEAIDEFRINNKENKVYGLVYGIEGNTASNLQFFLTDSSKHYLRGALYFSVEPQMDSIKPVLEFVRKDVEVMIKSFRWK